MGAGVLHRSQFCDARLQCGQDRPGGIRAAIVDHDDLMRNSL